MYFLVLRAGSPEKRSNNNKVRKMSSIIRASREPTRVDVLDTSATSASTTASTISKSFTIQLILRERFANRTLRRPQSIRNSSWGPGDQQSSTGILLPLVLLERLPDLLGLVLKLRDQHHHLFHPLNSLDVTTIKAGDGLT